MYLTLLANVAAGSAAADVAAVRYKFTNEGNNNNSRRCTVVVLGNVAGLLISYIKLILIFRIIFII